jgi:hypothetical protein
MIHALQGVGFKLEEIRQIQDAKNISLLETMLNRRIAEIEKERAELDAAFNYAQTIMQHCEMCDSIPESGRFIYERMPERSFVRIPLSDDLRGYTSSAEYEVILRHVRQQFSAMGYPLASLLDEGTIITRESFFDKSFKDQTIIVFVDGNTSDKSNGDIEVLPGGVYLTFLTMIDFLDDFSEAVMYNNMKFLNHIQDNNIETEGDLIGTEASILPRFFSNASKVLSSYQIKVAKQGISF